MSLTGNKILFGFTILCVALGMGACSPSPDTTLPTERIKITNIPAKIYRTEAALTTPAQKDTFKVYVQFSKGMTAADGSVAMGEIEVDPEKESTDGTYTLSEDGSTYTVTIDLFIPDTDIPYKSTSWSNIAVVISPEEVNDIFDIDAKAASKLLGGMQTSSSSSTVTLAWGNMLSKKAIMLYSVEDYLRLYGEVGASDGVIVTDTEITGAKVRANLKTINSPNLFNDKND